MMNVTIVIKWERVQIFMGEASRTMAGESAQPSLLLGIGFGLLSSLGPLAIDLYLPAMPGMASTTLDLSNLDLAPR